MHPVARFGMSVAKVILAELIIQGVISGVKFCKNKYNSKKLGESEEA